VLDPHGFVVAQTPTFVTARLVETVELSRSPTLYVRWGDWIVFVAAGAFLVLGTIAVWRGGRS
jgi:apolipoprotein N-acyltransferase